MDVHDYPCPNRGPLGLLRGLDGLRWLFFFSFFFLLFSLWIFGGFLLGDFMTTVLLEDHKVPD